MRRAGAFAWTTVDGVSIVDARGEIDLTNIQAFRRTLEDAALPECAAVIVSFLDTTYFDSHTVEALVQFGQRMDVTRRALLLVAPSESASGKLLRLVGVKSLFPMFESVEEAARSVKTPGPPGGDQAAESSS